jgi:hypothetical protein
MHRIANKLSDGPISIDKIRVDRADHVIQSLRDMPEHKHLAVNWSAMLKAIRSENPQQGRPAGREELAKQRVLLRMLACAAEREVGSVENANSNKKRKRAEPSTNSNESHESLSMALLKSLPSLLTAFKGDVMALRSLTKLPQYLIPAVFSLPARKNDFQSLLKNLCRLSLESTDEQVLQHIARALSILVQGDHTRVSEVKMQLKRMIGTLQDRLMELFSESDPQNSESPTKSKKNKKSSPKRRSNRKSDISSSSMSSEGVFSSNSPEMDIEHSICLCLLRWRTMIKECPLEFLFQEDDEEDEVEGFCTTISEAIGKRLIDRKPVVDEEDDDTAYDAKSAVVAKIWKTDDVAIHAEVAKAVEEALQVLLSVVSWKLLETLKDRTKEKGDADLEMEDDADVKDLVVLRMRDRLAKLVGLCFDQFLEEREDLIYSEEHVEFASSVQTSAGRVASDLRTLFAREWSQAADPVRRALALTDDSQLIGGFARYLQSRETEVCF